MLPRRLWFCIQLVTFERIAIYRLLLLLLAPSVDAPPAVLSLPLVALLFVDPGEAIPKPDSADAALIFSAISSTLCVAVAPAWARAAPAALVNAATFKLFELERSRCTGGCADSVEGSCWAAGAEAATGTVPPLVAGLLFPALAVLLVGCKLGAAGGGPNLLGDPFAGSSPSPMNSPCVPSGHQFRGQISRNL